MFGFTIVRKSEIDELKTRVDKTALEIIKSYGRLKEVAMLVKLAEEQSEKLKSQKKPYSLKEYGFSKILERLLFDLKGII